MRWMICFLALSLHLSRAAIGQEQVGFIPGEGPVFRVQVDFNAFAAKYHTQQMDEWCWAASISNVFAYYGHPVSQERIVTEAFGEAVDRPAPTGRLIAQLINRDWTDDNGTRFAARLTAAYDAQAGVNAINNMFMINELKNGRPIIVCNTHHCMVNTLIEYTNNRVVVVGVFDPWPGKGARNLTASEMIPATNRGELMFLGSLIVK